MLYFIVAILVFLVLATALILNLLPVFGAAAKGNRLARINASPNSKKGRFQYIEPTKVSTSFDLTKFPQFFRKGDTMPANELTTLAVTPQQYNGLPQNELRITWFGHSTLLFEIGGKRILTDPIFSPVPSPFSFLGNPAFPMTNAYSVADLPEIDIVLLSHDHYDHLDYPTILALKDKVDTFIAPLGVGAHLERWGIPSGNIQERDWWESIDIEGLKLTCTPARHFSGRGLLDRHKTLWCGWAIKHDDYHNILYGADSGYGPHFKQVGDQLGPFDFAMLENGQYNEMWKQIHAMPEELPQAWRELNARTIMPIHWGKFKLAMHPWTEPVERLLRAVGKQDERMITPRIGERFSPYEPEQYLQRWWREV